MLPDYWGGYIPPWICTDAYEEVRNYRKTLFIQSIVENGWWGDASPTSPPPPLDPPMEAEVAKQKYISVLVGSLDAPNQTFLVNCHPLDSGRNVNSSIILHTVDDILRQLETKRENFSLFLTDAARYMSSAGKTYTLL